MRALLFLTAGAALAPFGPLAPIAHAMPTDRRIELRERTRDLFKHGFDGYIANAYPADELRPLTCDPLLRDTDVDNVGVNDIHANASITLIDTLSALPTLYPDAFPEAVRRVAEEVSFDQDVKVQVFEMTIRAVGALLSTHQKLSGLPDDPVEQGRALGTKQPTDVKQYAPRMLELATDLATRLLPAFDTPTGLPYARVNLRTGLLEGETLETCTAGAGSLVLEFALLSRLTGDKRFESLAHRAFMGLWNRRSDEDLLGNGISVANGQWLAPLVSGVQAGIDSYFEYALKAAIMLDDAQYMDIFYDAYAAIQTHVRSDDGFFYRPISLRNTALASPSYVDSLSAFFPGVMVLAGDVQSAIKAHLVFWNVWQKFSALPEAWDPNSRGVAWGGWPGRPEFIESTYYLHRATGDDFYLKVGERVLEDITRRAVTSCGLASLGNVETGKQENRMESFFLSETLKYLYHLFDPADRPIDATVFSTEGHPLSMPQELKRAPSPQHRLNRRAENMVCPRYEPATMGGIPVGIEGRPDYDYAQWLVFGDDPLQENVPLSAMWKPKPKPKFTPSLLNYAGLGECVEPLEPVWSLQVILSPTEPDPALEDAPEDKSPSLDKVRQTEEGWEIRDVTGLRLTVRWRLDGTGYEVATIGPHCVRSGQAVVITDSRMRGYVASAAAPAPDLVRLCFYLKKEPTRPLLEVWGASAGFGKRFAASLADSPDSSAQRPFIPAEPAVWEPFAQMPVWHAKGDACQPIVNPGPNGTVYLVPRGGCDFSEKAAHVAAACGAGVLFLDTQEGELFKPASGRGVEEAQHVAAALIDKQSGNTLEKFLNVFGQGGLSVLYEDNRHVSAETATEGGMSVNGYDIVNVRVIKNEE